MTIGFDDRNRTRQQIVTEFSETTSGCVCSMVSKLSEILAHNFCLLSLVSKMKLINFK